MPDISTLLAVALAGLALSMTPGPSMLYVLSRSVGQSRNAGFASAIGLGVGGIVLAVATALGLAALFAEFPALVTLFRAVGSVYLIWLGILMIRDANQSSAMSVPDAAQDSKSFFGIVLQGIWVELLNPKTVLFFALFLPPFVDASGRAGSVEAQLLILGALVPLTAIPSDLFVAWMGGSMSQALRRNRTLQTVLSWCGGMLLIVIAANLQLQFI